MSIEIVRGELERLFSLEELMALSGELLSYPPSEVGGTASKASFAKALVERCVETHAVPALLDAVWGSRADLDPKLKDLIKTGVTSTAEWKVGGVVGPYTLTKKLGDGPLGSTFLAKSAEHPEVVLKLVSGAVLGNRTAVKRLMAQTKLLSRVQSEGFLPFVGVDLWGSTLAIAHKGGELQPLLGRVSRSGALHLNEARPILRSLLETLGALHAARLTHGNLKLENVLMTRSAQGALTPILTDGALDRLYAGAVHLGARSTSPEQLRGRASSVSSDLYAFGALAFELLTGKAPFGASQGADLAALHLTQGAPVASSVAPRGWIVKELDELLGRLLDKDETKRPKSAEALLEALSTIGKPVATSRISDEEFEAKVDAFVASPEDHEAAIALEATIEQGADATKVAEAFRLAVDGLEDEDAEKLAEAKKSFLFRAARILERAKKNEEAESIYEQICNLDEGDEVARTALLELRRSAGKFEEVIEMLLLRSESSESHSERARCLHRIGQIYIRELDDPEQGAFAYAQALSQDVQNDEYAADLERAAGTDMKLWTDALQTLTEASNHPRMPAEVKVTLYTRLGTWYAEKLARPDLGLPCFQAVLQIDPAHEGALKGMTLIYRRAQQWNELGQVLLRRADRAPTPERARQVRAEAADILETKLSDPGRARDLYEQIIAEDPGHDAACDALSRIYSALGDNEGLAKILERRAEALRGEARVEAICRVAELYEDQLNNLPEALRQYEAALAVDDKSLSALRGIDRILNRQGKYKELIEVLEKQLAIAATPRQKINLLERLAGIYDEEFIDHEKAAETLERLLAIDGTHSAALGSLIRHNRALDRWEEVVSGYERQLKLLTEDQPRIDTLLAEGRVLLEQVGSPHRAQKAFERVLEINPHHAGALESLANVRMATGDGAAALVAVEALAGKAEKPEQRSDLWVRAAKMLEERGDKDGAIERYKFALDALPTNGAAASALRAAYLGRGDASSAAELLSREIESTEGKIAKARLYGELAVLLRDKVKDDVRAANAATKAVDLDPTSLLGHMVTGDIAFEASRHLEAAKSYEVIANRADALPQADAERVVLRYIEALGKTGSVNRARGSVETLLKYAPNSPEAILASAKLYLESGDAARASDTFNELLKRFDDKLSMASRVEGLVGLGNARLSLGEFEPAIRAFQEATDLSPEANGPIDGLVKVYEAKQDWESLARMKTRRLDALTGEARTSMLLEIGDLYAQKLDDRTRASKSYVAALDERPDDRRVLTKLMQLYSEEKDWSKLIDIVVKLSSTLSDRKQRAKYLHTAAIVATRQLGEHKQAADFYAQVLDLDPSLEKALSEAIDVHMQLEDYEGVERLLKVQLDQATEVSDRDRLLDTFERLGVLYQEKLNWPTEAIDAFEAAQTLDPDDAARNEKLAALYASDPAQYLDKAVQAQRPILRKNPQKPEPYRLLRKLYTESKRADAAWCLCQALSVMNMAEPDEERFYRRMRSDGPAAAQNRLSPEDWASLMHEDADPLVTGIFQLIEPAVLKRNGQSLETLGYHAAYALDLLRHPYPMSQTLYYVGGVFGGETPPTFQNPEDPGGLAFLHAHRPAIVLGSAALALELPPQPAAFVAARHLAYYRPGLYIRHLVPTGTGLRAWLFAAIRLIVPAFPVSAEMEGPVGENLQLLDKSLVGPARDQLASFVTKLLQGGSIDLKKWVAGVDYSADRAGLLIAHDLEIALELVKGPDESTGIDRTRELLLFASSEEFFTLRSKLGVNIDA